MAISILSKVLKQSATLTREPGCGTDRRLNQRPVISRVSHKQAVWEIPPSCCEDKQACVELGMCGGEHGGEVEPLLVAGTLEGCPSASLRFQVTRQGNLQTQITTKLFGKVPTWQSWQKGSVPRNGTQFCQFPC